MARLEFLKLADELVEKREPKRSRSHVRGTPVLRSTCTWLPVMIIPRKVGGRTKKLTECLLPKPCP